MKPKAEQVAKCGNCGEAHSAAYLYCGNSYILAKKITGIKTSDKISYAAAAAKVRAEVAVVPGVGVMVGPAPSELIASQQTHPLVIANQNSESSSNISLPAILNKSVTLNPSLGVIDSPEINVTGVESVRGCATTQPITQSGTMMNDLFARLSRESLISLLRAFLEALLAVVGPSTSGIDGLLSMLLGNYSIASAGAPNNGTSKQNSN